MANGEMISYFDTLAPGYDERSAAGKYLTHEVLGDMLGELACDPQAVLDLGAGTGSTVAAILERTRPQRVVAVDATRAMLDRLRARYADDKRVEAVEADIKDYCENSEEMFDLVTGINVLPFIAAQTLMSGAAKRLRPGGLFICNYGRIIPGHPQLGSAQQLFRHEATGAEIVLNHYHPAKIVEALRHSGLSVVSNEPYAPRSGGDPTVQIAVARR